MIFNIIEPIQYTKLISFVYLNIHLPYRRGKYSFISQPEPGFVQTNVAGMNK